MVTILVMTVLPVPIVMTMAPILPAMMVIVIGRWRRPCVIHNIDRGIEVTRIAVLVVRIGK